ncbi:winged helix-turn-helix domain-containing protein [Demequina sp. NBRC 110056]|uniref:winged helix-turn-helix domain-containing protein n=1 Tax=Demequina sp. NBRC 110056 TaxID=1570345 RepID=UPI0013562E20|nr:crosslink repair DNA glycosylase YcaQ family protein [Demequina sp. NBRC 110056]
MSPHHEAQPSETLSAAQARRIFLNAQGLARRRPSRRVRERDFAAYLELQGVLQLDTVNILARAHYLPVFSRYGAYSTGALDQFLWGDPQGHSPHAFEHWGHEASVMPFDVLPHMHHRMQESTTWKARRRASLERERPGLVDQVRAMVETSGPLVGADVEHLAPREGPRGPWWDDNQTKDALELLFITGAVAASRGRHFARTYDACSRAWGAVPADAPVGPGEDAHPWGVPAAQAHQALFDRALSACGIGTAKDLCDHFRLPFQAGARTPDVAGGKAWAASAVERGIARWVAVEGWKDPALLAVGEADAEAPWRRVAADPGRATGAALLSPFDPVCWFRPRLSRMFGMDYRIEIYTPEPKRVYGYYCLPLLVGDQIPTRLDLKADRKAGVLRVLSSWREPGTARGARRLSDERIAAAAADELATMASWLGLDAIEVQPRGDLAPALLATRGVPPGGMPDAAIL